MRWNPFQFNRKPSRRRPIRKTARLGVEELESRFAPSTNVLTYHNDTASTGQDLTEVSLSPANVKVGSFGKLYTTALDGQIYAQPLVDNGVNITTGPNAGTRDVVFVVTEHDSLYAIDADDVGLAGTVLWQRSFLDATNPSNNTLGATAITSVPAADTGSTDLSPEVGITGTPVIDPNTNTLYLVTKTKETIGGAAHWVQRLHAINIGNGTDRVAPYLIGDTTGSYVNNTQIYVYGTGDGSTTDPYNGTGKSVVQFNALREHQRPALSLVNNLVYVAWASHGDNGPYHGWVAAWDVSNLGGNGMKLAGVFNTSPNNGEAGIWESSGALAFEADGSALYFETGNGTGGSPTLDANGFPVSGNYNDAVVKLVADPTTSPTNQNKNGWGFKVADYFIPSNAAALDTADQDFGAGGPLLLPDAAGITNHPHLLIAGGKEGKLYVLDRNNLGKFNASADQVVSVTQAISGLLSTPTWYNGKVYALSGYSGSAKSFVINANGTLSATSQTALGTFGYLPGSPSISANGSTNGIVWLMDRNTNQIHAYDAGSLATELWNSGQKAGGADNVGAVVKFAVPTVADGQVFVGTTNSLVVYGLTPPANAVPLPPTLAATALSGSSIQLTWQDATAPPNTATGYAIEESTDGTTFTPVTTAPAGSTALSIGGLQALTKYYFRIRGFNGLGYSNYSNLVNATTTNQAAVLDLSGGFAGSTGTLTYNGSAKINGSKGELTDGGFNEAGSFFAKSPVDVTTFNTQFTFQVTAGSSTADGFTFTIQGIGPTALGLNGGGLGYGPDHTGGTPGIGQSVAIKFDLYSNEGEGADSTGLYTNGAAPTTAGSIDLTNTGVNFHSGDLFQVVMTYDGTTLSVTILDTTTGKSATQSYTINIPSIVGNSTAYVGFTGGTGGLSATQDILTWTFAPNATQAPNAPTSLGATAASATSVNLTWTSNSANQSGFHLDRATDPNFTQNLITENLPLSPNSFTDVAIGLAPGGTYYYRLRAFNSAGDSANSNVATVTIPVAPPKPSNALVTDVSTSEIDLSWTDNAGRQADGYKILRAVDHGTFTVYALLPALNSTPPDTYEWADTSVSPGSFYEYHIVAYNISGNNDFAGTNATALTLPPSNVTPTSGNASVTLTWTAPTGAVSYNIYRGTTAGGEGTTPIATGVTTLSYTDTPLTNGTTYYYVVTAVNANAAPLDNESAPSSEVSALPQAGGLFIAHINFSNNTTQVPVGYINDIGLAYGARGNGLTYGWNIDNTVNARDRDAANSPDELHDSFIHMQKPSDPNASWSIAVPNGTYQVHLLSGDPQNWDSVFVINVNGVQALTGTPTSSNLWFEGTVTVTVTNGLLTVTNGTGSVNNKIDAIDIVQVVPTAPAAPTGLTASAGDTQATLNWTTVSGAITYNVYRGTSAGGEAATPVATGITNTTFTDTGLTDGTTYFYQVTAVNSAGESNHSGEASATPQVSANFSAHINFSNNTTQVPAGYINDIGLAYGPQGNGLTFGWNIDNTVNARDRDAANSPDELHDSFIHMQKSSDPNAFWSIAVPNGTYQVHLLTGDPQNWDSIYVLDVQGVQIIKAMPTSSNLWFEGTATVTVTNGLLTLSNGTGAMNNKIDAIDIVQVVTTPTAPAAPIGVVPTAGNAQVTLNWTASAGAVTYNIYRGTSAGGEGVTPVATGIGGTSFVDTSLTNGVTYYYQVTAVNSVGESSRSSEVSATPTSASTFSAHINFSNNTTQVPAGYINDIGLAYGPQGNGLTFGWNIDNTVNARDRDAANSPDELHDSFIHMQKPSDPNASWSIAVPNGTYQVHLLSGDPQNWDSVFVINVNGVQALTGTPTSSNLWFEGTVTVTVTNGLLTVTNGTGSVNNKIDAIDIVQTASAPSTPFAGGAALTLNGSAQLIGNKLELTNGGLYQAGSAFTNTALSVTQFTTQFDFQLTNATADGFAFVIQNAGANALGSTGGGLGYGPDTSGGPAGIAQSLAIKFDLYSNEGEGSNSTGLFTNGQAPTIGGLAPSSGSTDLTSSGLNLHSGDVFHTNISYDGTTLVVTITDTNTNATASQSYVVNIAGIVGGSSALFGFTGGTGGLSATQDILNWVP